MQPETFKLAVNNGLATGDWQLMTDWINKESSFSFNERKGDNQPFDEQVFGCIIDLLRQADFLEAEDSSVVLSVIENDWSLLTVEQKSRLLSGIVQAYPSFKDPISCFIIAEILGEYFADEDAFHALQHLESVEREEPRSLVPMGFEQIVRHSSKELATRAFKEIIKMREDDFEQVRMEADISLNRLASQDLLPFLRQEEQE